MDTDINYQNNNHNDIENSGLKPYLNPAGAWALALGTSVGWGSMVVTSKTYLAQAGPAGSIIGLLAATVIMIVIAKNYHYLMNSFPDSGGAYTYAKEVFGYDHGFLAAWFLFLSYMAVFWANATSLPLFAKYFIGDIFQFGFHYTVFGYELYFGEILLTIVTMFVFGLICISSNKILQIAMVIMAAVFFVGIAVCFVVSAGKHVGTGFSFEPFFVLGESAAMQAIRIACISPWAFIGFENISHSTGEFKFSRSKSFKILSIAVISSTVVSFIIPFLGRTAIGWIIDVTTIGATIIYGFVSASAYKLAKDCEDKKEKITGFIGMAAILLIGIFLLLPNLISAGTMAEESYILFTAWAVIGFFFFRSILKRDTQRRFGKSIIVWIGLLLLMLFTSLVWMNRSSMSSMTKTVDEIREYYTDSLSSESEQIFINERLDELGHENIKNMAIVVVLFVVAVSMLLTNYRLMSKRAQESEEELGNIRNTAYTDPLTGVKSKLCL